MRCEVKEELYRGFRLYNLKNSEEEYPHRHAAFLLV
jgi:hypothetical protein